MTTTASRPAFSTRSLLTCAVVAAPLWASVSLVQAATREGFDLTRLPLSMLSVGSLGWVQVLNFLVGGLLTVLGAIGLGRVLPGRWAARLVAVSGVGMIGAGVFTMDPADPFGGASLGHMAAGTLGFATLVAACYVLGRHFTGRKAVASYVAGTALLLGDLWAMSGGAAGSLTLAIGWITALLWISFVAARYRCLTLTPCQVVDRPAWTTTATFPTATPTPWR
ncbi:DUF998 domain-containing protein [Amycolatopsis sp. 195334CR]|uniref:DUF998 domain-containing protein n=1 Tax=Amycolatopsis sp. 195334CR TaxID=2814588 RepID=UPI001A8D34C1|nr:DUF998 domain-containing protein [Amycolatopsis sp. 195334CR]MBN6039943.1 DUF998 domain-containing protein [Amycolatopsis sp. 195334CR]